MKVRYLILISIMFSSLAFGQNNAGTGRKEIDEKSFNEQLENCKVDANVAPAANSSGTNVQPGTSSKGKAQ